MALKRVLKTKNGFITSYKKAIKALVEIPVTNKISVSDLPKTQELYTPTSDPTVWKDYAVFINNGDGSITVDAKSMSLAQGVFFTIDTTSGHKYLLRGCPQGGIQNISYWIGANVKSENNTRYLCETGEGLIFDGADSVEIAICVRQDTDGAIVFTPELYDLTELYEAGREPLTVEEAEEGLEAGKFDRYIISREKAIRFNTSQKWQPSRVGNSLSKEGITLTTNKVNGTITISGVCTKDASNFSFSQTYYIQNHIYFARTGLKGTTSPLTQFGFGYTGFTIDKPVIFLQHRATGYIYDLLYCNKGTDFSTPQTIRPELYDLTEIFGAGNEPKTVEEAEALLGKDYIPYQYI